MKGQSAVEFFMTYGWALLALVIVIGVLISTGIMSPNYLLSEECSLGSNVRCDVAFFNNGTQSQMNIRVYNGFPYAIKVNQIELSSSDTPQSLGSFAKNITIDSGSDYTFVGYLSGPEVANGNMMRFSGNITYQSCAPELGPCGTAPSHIISGIVAAKIIQQ